MKPDTKSFFRLEIAEKSVLCAHLAGRARQKQNTVRDTDASLTFHIAHRQTAVMSLARARRTWQQSLTVALLVIAALLASWLAVMLGAAP